jgi:hypothetical protein
MVVVEASSFDVAGPGRAICGDSSSFWCKKEDKGKVGIKSTRSRRWHSFHKKPGYSSQTRINRAATHTKSRTDTVVMV